MITKSLKKAYVRETKTITILDLARLVLEQSILDSNSDPDSIGLVSEIARCRAEEIVQDNKTIEYIADLEAFTCEVANTGVYVIKHNSLKDAIQYVMDNIGEISIVYNEQVVVLSGFSEGGVFWGYTGMLEMQKMEIESYAHIKGFEATEGNSGYVYDSAVM